ncbi:MAG TPA: tetratricopeptide repeat protein [Geobacteraceae bacterium]
MSDKHMFRYTPSLMSKEDLEALFVQREDLLARVVDQIHDSAVTPAKYHFLLVGPRGTGKTHTVSLVYHRVKDMEDIRGQLLIAWLREEEWGISSFLDLLQRILRSLQEEYGDTSLTERIESLYKMKPAQAEKAAAQMLKEFVGNRSLLLIVENLDSLFDGLGEEGQKRLRAYLQENPFCSIVATAPSLFSGISIQASPFYGFFVVHHLESLDAEQATQMLIKIACVKGDNDLASLLQTPTGHARVGAIHHLAGGNHRIYVILAQFLTRESLDQLVEPFLGTMDDLTPYYQSRMMMLPHQQRKIVEFLCERSHPVPVKEIAQRCFITHQTASSQLKLLRERCYVTSIPVGRESYYELREPLMRLCLEVKKYRGEPIRLFIEFLRYWYTRSDIKMLIESIDDNLKSEKEYLSLALQLYEKESNDKTIQDCMSKCEKFLVNNDYAKALQAIDKLLAIRGHKVEGSDLAVRGTTLACLQKYSEALEAFDKAIELDPSFPFSWSGKALALQALERYEESLSSADKALSLGLDTQYFVWSVRGDALKQQKRYQEALDAYDMVIKLDPNFIKAWQEQSDILLNLGRFEEALASINKVLELSKNDTATLKKKVILLFLTGNLNEAYQLINTLIDSTPNDFGLWRYKGYLLYIFNSYHEAIDAFKKAVELGSTDLLQYYYHSFSLIMSKRWKEAYVVLDGTLQKFAHDVDSGDGDVGSLITKLLMSPFDRAFWSKAIQIVTDLYSKHESLSALSGAVVTSVKTLQSPEISDVVAHAWYDEWKSQAGHHPEMQLPLRLLNVAVRYREKKDMRILLELPFEERKILEPLLGVKEPTE